VVPVCKDDDNTSRYNGGGTQEGYKGSTTQNGLPVAHLNGTPVIVKAVHEIPKSEAADTRKGRPETEITTGTGCGLISG
jgi:hypothetical protein